MRSKVSLSWVLALAASPVLAQDGDDWETPSFPTREEAPAPLPTEADLPPPPLTVTGEDERFAPPPEPEEDYFRPAPPLPPLDSFTLYGGRALGRGRNVVALTAGYPYITLRYARGIGDRWDLGISAKTFYGMMTEGSADLRWELVRLGVFSLAANASVGGAYFVVPARTESVGGARWITGRRHINGEVGGSISVVPSDGRGFHPFVDVRYLLAVDLEPTNVDPLGGLPPPYLIAGNTLVRLGGEVPLSNRASLVGLLGFDVHGRREDSRVFFNIAFGVLGAF